MRLESGTTGWVILVDRVPTSHACGLANCSLCTCSLLLLCVAAAMPVGSRGAPVAGHPWEWGIGWLLACKRHTTSVEI